MRRLLPLLCLPCLAFVPNPPVRPAPASADLRALQGEWVLESASPELLDLKGCLGEWLLEFATADCLRPGWTATYSGRRVDLVSPNDSHREACPYNVWLDPEANPKKIQLSMSGRPATFSPFWALDGSYEVKGDTLCIRYAVNEARYLVGFKREKPVRARRITSP